MDADVIVVGGGPAGTSAAIHLARRGHRVTLIEKKTYPEHKLCGEFLSIEAIDILGELGVMPAIREAGAEEIDTAYFTSSGGASFTSTLPSKALGISRYQMDYLLAQQAEACGATLMTGEGVQSIEGNLEEGFTVSTRSHRIEGQMVVGAYGKRDLIDKKLNRPFLKRDSPFVAFKAHYEGFDIGPVVEIHAFQGGYCGMSPVEKDRVNVCWIARKLKEKSSIPLPAEMINNAFKDNAVLSQRMDSLRRVSTSFIAVGQVTFQEKGTFAGDVCMIGDTAGMIAPVCGDGMVMAMQSSALSIPWIDGFLQGHVSREELQSGYTKAWRKAFRPRMSLGRFLHHGILLPSLANSVINRCDKNPRLAEWFFRHTRGL